MAQSSGNFWQTMAERLLIERAKQVTELNQQYKQLYELEMKVRHQEATIRSYKIMIESMRKIDLEYAPIRLQYIHQFSNGTPKVQPVLRVSLTPEQSESLTNSIVSP